MPRVITLELYDDRVLIENVPKQPSKFLLEVIDYYNEHLIGEISQIFSEQLQDGFVAPFEYLKLIKSLAFSEDRSI